MHSFKIAASMAALASLVVAAPTALTKRATGPSNTDTDFINAIVNTHNAHREIRDDVPNLTWDTTLADYAKDAANKCQFAHTGGPYGENLFAIYPGYDDWTSGTVDGVNAWVYEAKDYDYDNPGFSMSTGHFTQAVWKGSKTIGCSWNTVACDGAAYLFCEYDSPGNVIGYFPENVLRTSN